MEELAQLKQQLTEQRPDSWDDLPDIPLYMDQVVGYLARQMVNTGEGDALTSAMINNYIKDGLVERANGKKYGQEHLAYLTAIAALKQVMSVREMKVLTTVGREMRAPSGSMSISASNWTGPWRTPPPASTRTQAIRTCPSWCWTWPCGATPTAWPATGRWRCWPGARPMRTF